MKSEITSDISRLSLHDSSFIDIVRNDQNLDLTFDWSKLDDFREGEINEGIIIGKTKMSLTGVHSEYFKIFNADEERRFLLRPMPDDYQLKTEAIGTSSINDDTKKIIIGKLYKESGIYFWTEWNLKFLTCKLSWTSFVTYSEWKNGKLPDD